MSSAAETPTGPLPERVLRVRCPHCGNRIDLVEPDPHEVVCGSCGSSFHLEPEATASLRTERTPETVGRFIVLARLGRGAFGTVYKARDPELDRVVAVKVPRAGSFGSADEEARFLREARAAARLHHPGIVTVYEVTAAEPSAIVSEFVDGPTLADRLTAGRPSFRESAELVAALADALDFAHRHGVVHRDVKPSNVLLDAAGKPHLADFGLARRDEAGITMTLDGQILGTPAYMSPEQAAGTADVDGRADVYSLGVILYELLAGELPFRGNARMLVHQLLHDDPKPPRKLNDHIPRDLETVTLKVLAKAPHQRYATAGELAADLRRWLDGKPVLARPVGRVTKAWRWARRNPAVAALLAAVAVVSVFAFAVTAGFALFYRDATEKKDSLLLQAAKREGELTLDKGRTLCERGDLKAGLLWQAKGLAMLEQTGADEDDVWAARMGLSLWGQTYTAPVARYDGSMVSGAWVPNSDLFVARAGHDVVVHDLFTGRVVQTLPRPGPLELISSNPQFGVSVDGKTVGVLNTVHTKPAMKDDLAIVVTVWDLSARAERTRARIETEDPRTLLASSVIWSPGLTFLAIDRSVGGYQVYDARTGKRVPIPVTDSPEQLLFAPDDLTHTAWRDPDADGPELVRGWLRETATGRKLCELVTGPNQFSPDGRFLLVWHKGRVRKYDTRTGAAVGDGFECSLEPNVLEFTDDGKWLIARKAPEGGGTDPGEWRAWAWPSGEPWPHPNVHPATVSPDGRFALESGSRLVRWPSGERYGNPLPVANAFLGYSADGSMVITSTEYSLACWSTRTGQMLGPKELGLAVTVENVSLWNWKHPEERIVLDAADRRGKYFTHRWLRPVAGTSERIILWAQVATGSELDDDGVVRPLDEAELAVRKRRLDELGGSPLPGRP